VNLIPSVVKVRQELEDAKPTGRIEKLLVTRYTVNQQTTDSHEI
jgi:hypothetical protein